MMSQSIDFEFIKKLIWDRSAIVLEQDKMYLIESRLMPVARKEGLTDLNELINRLKKEKNSPLHTTVVDAMTTNETSFFRDLHPFESLRTDVFPQLMTRRGIEKKLNIWCCASSTGQELYTIGMVVKEHFPTLNNWKVTIMGTDINKTVLERAREGKYSQLEVNRGLPASMLIKYFQRNGMEYQAKEELRKLMDLREMNLATEWPALPSTDVIFLRNVLIYFDVETKKKILTRVKRVLRPDGFLFLGGAETTMNLDDGFERTQFGKASCYRLKR